MTPSGNFCGRCGRANADGASFCVGCGLPLVGAGASSVSEAPVAPGSGPVPGAMPPPPPGAFGSAPPPPPGYPGGAVYGAPAPGSAPYGVVTPSYGARQETNGLAIASLVLGILWIAGFGSLLAIVFGFVGKRQIRESGGRQSGDGLALAGIILGFLGLLGVVLWIVLIVTLFVPIAHKIENCTNAGGVYRNNVCITNSGNTGFGNTGSPSLGALGNRSNSGVGSTGGFGFAARSGAGFAASPLRP